MSTGYKRDIVMRIVPVNGAETVYWFTDRLTDLGMHIRCTPTYPRTMTVHEDLNRVLRTNVQRKSAQIQIEVFIATMTDQWFLQEIEEALDDSANYAVFLSLDGGVVERQVVWLNSEGVAPQPLRGKTVVGATFVLSLQTKAPVGPRGPMMTDPGVGAELVQDGGMEQWPTQSWEATGTLTLAQETTIISGGVSSAKVTRADTSFQDFRSLTAAEFRLRSGVWYRYRAMVRGSVAMANAFQLRLSNSTQAKEVAPDGKTWGASGTVFLTASVTTDFALMEGYFRRYPQDPGTDKYRPRHVGTWTAAESLYYDDVSVYGPVLRPGVATW